MEFLLSLLAIVVLLGNSNSFEIQPKIINGFKATPYQFPSYVYLHTLLVNNEVFKCAGVLISDRWILTAGHCLTQHKNIEVFLGYLPDGNYTGKVTINPTNQHIFPLANSTAYDIALIKLPGAVISNVAIAPIRLPSNCNTDHLYNEVVLFPGTGMTSFEPLQIRDRTLKYAICTTLPRDLCEKFADHPTGSESTIYSYSQNGQSPFKGDSGGAVIRQRDHTLIGIGSHVFPSSFVLDGKPVVVQGITNLYYFFDWISEKTGLELPKCLDDA